MINTSKASTTSETDKIHEIILLTNDKTNDKVARSLLKDFEVSYYSDIIEEAILSSVSETSCDVKNIQKENITGIINKLSKIKTNVDEVLVVADNTFLEIWEKELNLKDLNDKTTPDYRIELNSPDLVPELIRLFNTHKLPNLKARLNTSLLAYTLRGVFYFNCFQVSHGVIKPLEENAEKSKLTAKDLFFPILRNGKISEKPLSEFSENEQNKLPVPANVTYKVLAKKIKRQNRIDGAFGWIYNIFAI